MIKDKAIHFSRVISILKRIIKIKIKINLTLQVVSENIIQSNRVIYNIFD